YCGCQSRLEQGSSRFRRCWSFFISRRSGHLLRQGRHGQLLSDGSRAYNRSSPGVPIAASVSVSLVLGRPTRAPTKRFSNCSIGHSGTAPLDCGRACLFWVIGSLRNDFWGTCEVCYAVLLGPRSASRLRMTKPSAYATTCARNALPRPVSRGNVRTSIVRGAGIGAYRQ